ncbi:MAG: hypothetical protein AB7R90_00730 [Reyranellaceae bacterium]
MTTTGTVFVHTNEKQIVGAIVSAYSMKRNSRHADAFDVQIIHFKDYPFLAARDGQGFLRDGVTRVWRNDDLQSFTPLRFMPPKLMGYQGRAVVVDPDVFAVGDVHELLSRDMQGKALMCKGRGEKKQYASSVMLLDCARLAHWDCEREFGELFEFKRDYMDWISLKCEPEGTIGLFEEEWNHFDTLNEHTKMLHNTRRRTQPWKSGLPIDFQRNENKVNEAGFLRRLKRSLIGEKPAVERTYIDHPDPNQVAFFFGLVRECMENGLISEAMLREQMRLNHVRHDALRLIDSLDRQKVA